MDPDQEVLFAWGCRIYSVDDIAENRPLLHINRRGKTLFSRLFLTFHHVKNKLSFNLNLFF